MTHPASDRLLALGLAGMAKALDEQRRLPATFDSLTFEERLGLLVDHEAAERDAKRLLTRLKFAALRQAACVEDLDLRTPRGIAMADVMQREQTLIPVDMDQEEVALRFQKYALISAADLAFV